MTATTTPPALKHARPLSTLVACQVRVYRNLTRKCWSVEYRENYLRGSKSAHRWVVAGHSQALVLQDVRFTVNPATRDRVRATGKKEVHAWAIGRLVACAEWCGTDGGLYFRAAGMCHTLIGYNPKRDDLFTVREAPAGDPVSRANMAHLEGTGMVLVDLFRPA